MNIFRYQLEVTFKYLSVLHFFSIEEAQSLEGDARKDYAERVAFAFMEALGIDDDDDEGGESEQGDR